MSVVSPKLTAPQAQSERDIVALKGLGEVIRWLSRSHFHVSA